MKTPTALQALIDDGVIDEVLRPLKSGKEAAVYVVRSGDDVRCAKVYKDMAQRSFQQRVQYQEGRKVRGSREARAIGKAHASTAASSRKPPGRTPRSMRCTSCATPACACREPYGYFHGVLVMELVDRRATGSRRRGWARSSSTPEQAREFHAVLVRQVVRMLCCGLIHGDLSALQRAGRRRMARW